MIFRTALPKVETHGRVSLRERNISFSSFQRQLLEISNMKKLPIGIQNFPEIIKEEYLYVDKTKHIEELIQSGKYFFLSRPRRFGKSLLVSTLHEIFSGNKHLFKGLAIYDKIEWQSHPIIHIDFSAIDYATETKLQDGLIEFLDGIKTDYQLEVNKGGFKAYFKKIIQALSKKYGKVVVLIDEYDKPIVDYIDDIEKATKNRKILKEFFGVLKPSDAFLRFVFLTGVSKFSKVSIFSELNNLRDITLSKKFATLLGYTQTELESYFEKEIQSLCFELGIKKAALLAKIKTWYNGYSWNAKDTVYNPFSILNLFAEQRFSNYWFATGTPTFLMKLIKKKQQDVTTFENKKLSEMVFDSYNIESMNIFALLFQTGYLTVTDIENKELFREYTLNYPNVEVKQAFVTYLLESFTNNEFDEIQPLAYQLRMYLQADNLEGFMNIMKALFAKIP
ncbi:AAA family ATPase [Candidatus Parabeggiatoa sp. HSG14]|uniref:ATP-binding protein n=1 Tax=Candidatus Parabeggiatoa sp. HSG14 TaxID=3055593 RepID=UPI0025A78D1E|nr:AAA family ATPase [Thiotrichales bacterium HSG14]